MTSLSIIIVSFNNLKDLKVCLTSLEEVGKPELEFGQWEIIFVDNGSVDGSVDFLRQYVKKAPQASKFKLIENQENLGFSRANNLGLAVASGKYILLLNSDTSVKPEAIQDCLAIMDKNDRIGALTCKLILGNGKIDSACHRGFPTLWNAFCYFSGLEKMLPKVKLFSGYHQFYKGLTTFHEVDAISGAFFLTRRETIEEVGKLDEDYFMYGEDLDWCYRMKEKKWLVYFFPEAQTIHFKKRSGRQSGNRLLEKKTRHHFISTMGLFYQKYYASKNSPVVNYLVQRIISCLAHFSR